MEGRTSPSVRLCAARLAGRYSLLNFRHKVALRLQASAIVPTGSHPNAGNLSLSCFREPNLKEQRKKSESRIFLLTTLCLPASPDGCLILVLRLRTSWENCLESRLRRSRRLFCGWRAAGQFEGECSRGLPRGQECPRHTC